MARVRGFVIDGVGKVRAGSTPAYDVGATEGRLREDYLARFSAMQEAWFEAHDSAHGQEGAAPRRPADRNDPDNQNDPSDLKEDT